MWRFFGYLLKLQQYCDLTEKFNFWNLTFFLVKMLWSNITVWGKKSNATFWWFSNIERARKDKRILDLWFISGDWEAFLSSRQEWKWHLQPCGAQWKATSGLKAFEWPSILPNGIPLSRNGTKLSIAFRYFLLRIKG